MDNEYPAEPEARLARLDRIQIRELLLRCIVGINPDERAHKQDVVIDITLYSDLSRAGQSDNIDDTVNYKTIKNQVVDLVEASTFFLVERLAEEISRVCLSHPGVQAARVAVDKPGALRFARSVGVEILRFHGAG